MANKIQQRRDTAYNWSHVNPTLSSGEFGYETDTKKLKIGDGTTAWSALDYFTSGSSVAGVVSVNGQTGTVVLTKADFNLSNVDNTADSAKPVSVATAAALSLKESLANKGIASGYVGLNDASKIDSIFLPAITLNNRFAVSTLAERNALNAVVGDIAIVAGTVNKTYILNALPASSDPNWLEMLNPLGGVTSINGNTGTVSLTLTNIPGTLTTDKLPALTGDVISSAGTGILTLSNSGITAGTYNRITFDSKGRATSGETVDYATTNASLLTSGTLGVARLPAFTGDVVSLVGTGVLTLGASGVTAGSNYNSITVNAKGIVTAASIIPVYNKTEIDSQLSLKLDTNKLNQANGYVGLNSNGKIDSLYLPAFTVNNRFAVTTIAQRNALTAAIGDIAIVAGTVNKTYILNALPASSDANWLEMLNPLGGVTSVNGHTGVVTITLNDLTGTISATALPSLTGDVISSAGSNIISLNSITTAGTFNKVQVNDKGLVTSASFETTLAGLGITDGTTVSQVNALIAAAIGGGSGGSASISSGDTPPVNPVNNELWFDTTGGRLYVFYSNTWIDTNPEAAGAGSSGSITTGDTAPSSPSVGDLWFDTNGGRLYVYYSNAWIDTNPESTSAGGTSQVTVNSIAPSSASVGDLWYDTVSGRLFVYYSGTWVDTNPEANTNTGSVTTMSDTPPTSPNPGDLWFDTTGGRLYIRYSNAWVDTNPNPN